MSQTPNDKDVFDIDFSDLLVQDSPLDEKLANAVDASGTDAGLTDTGLSADDLSFLESLSNAVPETKPAPEKIALNPVADKPLDVLKSDTPVVDKVATPTADVAFDALKTVEKSVVSEPIIPAAPTKKSLFGGKFGGKSDNKKLDKKADKTSDIFSKPVDKKSKSTKNPIVPVLAVMGVILVLGLLWVFLGGSGEQAAVPPTEVVSQTAPTEPSEITTEAVPLTEAETTPVSTAGAETSSTETQGSNFTPIDVDAIVQAEVPDDPVLIKEEIDRLADENARLADQAKDIDGILSDTQKLTAAKEEQIALLEAQIAQLEAQQGK